MHIERVHTGPPTPARAPSRRGFTLGGLLLPLAAVAAPQPAHAAAWRELLPSLSFLHRNGRRAALAARDAGLNPADLFNILLTGRNPPALMFNGEPGATVYGDGSVTR